MAEAALGGLQVEAGSWGPVLAAERVAIVAHWSAGRHLTRSVQALLHQLASAQIATVLVSASEVSGALVLGSAEADLVLRRRNVGYDFGSWAQVLLSRPELTRDRRVLLLNDSLAGPFRDGGLPLDQAIHSQADVWGLVASGQFGWHLQSYFISYAPGVLGEPALSRFWSGVGPLPTKQQVITRYELGLSHMLRREAFTLEAHLPAGTVCPVQDNPMILGWRGVLDQGVAVVKRELLREPALAPDGLDVPDELRRRYRVDAREWV